MAIDKDFVVKNGLEVNENLLYADDSTGKVGIGTTEADKKLVVIGDAEVSSNLSVGTTITAQRGVFSGIVTVTDGFDLGVGGTFLSAVKADKKIGINSANPVYTLDIIGPVSTGTTATYIFGDLEVTGNIKGTNLQGQISAGGTVQYTNVTVDNILDANNAEVYTKFNIEEVNSNTFRYLTAGTPPGIGFTQNTDDPELYLQRAAKYEFHVSSAGFPFYIKTQPTADLNNQYNDGVVNNGAQVGVVTFKVPFNAPNKLYYQASNTAGMGGTIYINNDYKDLEVGVLTVTQFLDSKLQADFDNIYVSGIGTINNLKGPQDFSVSAGILTVRQDQTALIGVSTGADRLSVQEKSDNTNYQLSFTEPLGIGSNYQNFYVDSENGQLQYNPSTNTLTVANITATLTGISTGSQRVNIDGKSDNTNYQVAFTEPGTDEYQALYLDTQSAQFTYNPSTNTLTAANFVGDLTGDVTGTVTNANFINVDETNDNTTFQVLFSPANGTGYERPLIDTNDAQFTYNPSTQDFTVGNLNGNGSNVTDIHGPNITTGVIDVDRLPDASTTAQGVSQLYNTYPPVSTAPSTSAATGQLAYQIYNELTGSVIPQGTVMLFHQASAPNGWTQTTANNVNNRALRVVNGTGANTGGNMAFTNAFAERSYDVPQHTHTANAGNQSANHSHNISVDEVNNHIHSINDPGHAHTYVDTIGELINDNEGENEKGEHAINEAVNRTTSNANTGINETQGAGEHTHNANLSNQTANHNHTITVSNTGTAGATIDFRVRYLDVIICTKNNY